jgi:hypothetical protein
VRCLAPSEPFAGRRLDAPLAVAVPQDVPGDAEQPLLRIAPLAVVAFDVLEHPGERLGREVGGELGAAGRAHEEAEDLALEQAVEAAERLCVVSRRRQERSGVLLAPHRLHLLAQPP